MQTHRGFEIKWDHLESMTVTSKNPSVKMSVGSECGLIHPVTAKDRSRLERLPWLKDQLCLESRCAGVGVVDKTQRKAAVMDVDPNHLKKAWVIPKLLTARQGEAFMAWLDSVLTSIDQFAQSERRKYESPEQQAMLRALPQVYENDSQPEGFLQDMPNNSTLQEWGTWTGTAHQLDLHAGGFGQQQAQVLRCLLHMEDVTAIMAVGQRASRAKLDALMTTSCCQFCYDGMKTEWAETLVNYVGVNTLIMSGLFKGGSRLYVKGRRVIPGLGRYPDYSHFATTLVHSQFWQWVFGGEIGYDAEFADITPELDSAEGVTKVKEYQKKLHRLLTYWRLIYPDFDVRSETLRFLYCYWGSWLLPGMSYDDVWYDER